MTYWFCGRRDEQRSTLPAPLSLARRFDNSMSMKSRHAVALAIIGWYLMVPPVASTGRVDASEPLWKWWKFQIDASAQECETFLSELQQGRVTEADWEVSKRAALELGHTPTLNPEEMQKRNLESLCIEEHDPFLKEK
jgi:hypothetical protein